MNLILKGYWSNNPISIDEVIQNPELVLRVPVGMVTISAGVDKAYVDEQDSLLGNEFATALQGLDDKKANAIVVTQALSTKADLIDGVIPASQLPSYVELGGGTASYPSFTGNAGKVLVVNSTEDGVEWVTLPSGGEIPSNEMHFTTLAGSVDYVGTQGDQILLSDNSIVDITATNATVTFNAPAGKHKVKLVESAERNNYVSVGGEALVELHNFPTLSTVTKFNFSTYNYNFLPNLTKVPNFLPSNITDMYGMFIYASAFNQDISNWNVSNVTDMYGMFAHATSFDQPLNNWNVSNVTDMYGMFINASSFNQPLNNWNVSNVTDMYGMFYYASVFNQDLSNWCVSNILTVPDEFNTGAPLLVGAKLPRWGTCPAP